MFDFFKELDDVSRTVFIFISDLMVEMMRNEVVQEKKLREESLIMSEYVLLTLIAKSDDLTINMLADESNVTASTMVTRINHLEEKELISRVRGSTDRRKVYVRISDKGRQIISKIGEFRPEVIVLEKLQVLTTKEKDLFKELIEKINSASDVTSEDRAQLVRFMLNKRLFETSHVKDT